MSYIACTPQIFLRSLAVRTRASMLNHLLKERRVNLPVASAICSSHQGLQLRKKHVSEALDRNDKMFTSSFVRSSSSNAAKIFRTTGALKKPSLANTSFMSSIWAGKQV